MGGYSGHQGLEVRYSFGKLYLHVVSWAVFLAYLFWKQIEGDLCDQFAVYAFRIIARQQLGEDVPSATNTHIGHIVFYAVRVVSKERMRLVLHRTSYLSRFCFMKVLRMLFRPDMRMETEAAIPQSHFKTRRKCSFTPVQTLVKECLRVYLWHPWLLKCQFVPHTVSIIIVS
jgi:hypothetical protein